MEAKKEMKDINLLEAMERIVALAKGSELSDEFYNKADEYICFIADKLQLSKEQSVMLSLFVNNSDECNIVISDIAKFLHCNTIRVLKYMSDIDELVRREYVFRRADSIKFVFRIHADVVDSFRRNELFTVQVKTNLSAKELFTNISEVFEMRDDKDLSYEQTELKINRLLEANMHLQFVQRLQEYDIPKDDKLLLILFCHLLVTGLPMKLVFITFLFSIQAMVGMSLNIC